MRRPSWCGCDFENLPRPLKKGETVYVEMTRERAEFIGFRMVRWLTYAPVGLRQADWGLKGMGGQRDEGSGWKSLDMGKVKPTARYGSGSEAI